MLLMVALIAAAVSAGAWYHANAALNQTRSQLFVSELQPISTMLKENQTLINELQPEPFTEKGSGVLEAYLTKIRRDGVPQHAELKHRLDTLAENNATIVALIKAYSPHARTPAFTPEGGKFRNYASAWPDRWNSVMELEFDRCGSTPEVALKVRKNRATDVGPLKRAPMGAHRDRASASPISRTKDCVTVRVKIGPVRWKTLVHRIKHLRSRCFAAATLIEPASGVWIRSGQREVNCIIAYARVAQ